MYIHIYIYIYICIHTQLTFELILGVHETLSLNGVGARPAARPAAEERPEDLPPRTRNPREGSPQAQGPYAPKQNGRVLLQGAVSSSELDAHLQGAGWVGVCMQHASGAQQDVRELLN